MVFEDSDSREKDATAVMWCPPRRRFAVDHEWRRRRGEVREVDAAVWHVEELERVDLERCEVDVPRELHREVFAPGFVRRTQVELFDVATFEASRRLERVEDRVRALVERRRRVEVDRFSSVRRREGGLDPAVIATPRRDERLVRRGAWGGRRHAHKLVPDLVELRREVVEEVRRRGHGRVSAQGQAFTSRRVPSDQRGRRRGRSECRRERLGRVDRRMRHERDRGLVQFPKRKLLCMLSRGGGGERALETTSDEIMAERRTHFARFSRSRAPNGTVERTTAAGFPLYAREVNASRIATRAGGDMLWGANSESSRDEGVTHAAQARVPEQELTAIVSTRKSQERERERERERVNERSSRNTARSHVELSVGHSTRFSLASHIGTSG